MNIEDMYILLNLDTDELEERMIRKEDEGYLTMSDEEHIKILLKEDGLSLSSLEGSFATIHNVDKKLYIRFEENEKIYTPTLLNFIEFPRYIKYANTFNTPKKVKLIEVSSQVGGHIDINYGIKFKIQILDDETSEIYKSKNLINKKESRVQADVFLRRKFGISINQDEYDASINSIMKEMSNFFTEGLSQTKYHLEEKKKDDFDIFYNKDKTFFFGIYKDEYFAIADIEESLFLYKKVYEELIIISGIDTLDMVSMTIDKYNKTFS